MAMDLLGTDIDRYSLVLVDPIYPSFNSTSTAATGETVFNSTELPVNMNGTLQGEAVEGPPSET